MQGKVISCIKPLLYLGKKRQASGHVSLTSESVFKAKRKVERSGSGLTGAVNQIIWAQQFLSTAGRKHTAYWDGEYTGRVREVLRWSTIPYPQVFHAYCFELSRSPLYYSPPGTEKHAQ